MMFYVILVGHDYIPTLFGPYCSFKSALDIVQGPIGQVPVGSITEVDETYTFTNHELHKSVTISEALPVGKHPQYSR